MRPQAVMNSTKKPFFEEGRYPFVSDRRHEDVAIISIERPEKGNSLSPAVLFNLRRTMERAIDDPAITGIVLTAAQPGFVQGASIDYLIRRIRDDQFDRLHFYTDLGNDCFDLIANAPKPIIALVNGIAVGGGVELTLACHARFAVAGSSFSLPETGLGICPIWGAIPRLSRLLGKDLAKWMVYSGKQVSAKEAVSLGLIHKVVSASEALKATVAAIRNLSGNPKHQSVMNPEFIEVVKFFQGKTVKELFTGPLPPRDNRLLFGSIRRLKQNSFLALQYSEKIFDAIDLSSSQFSVFYRNLVEELYRSQDTILGLEWKKEGKIAFPSFLSNAKQ